MKTFKIIKAIFQTVMFLFILGSGFSPVYAEDSSTDNSAPTTSGSWILSVGGAVDFPHANWNLDYRVGIGSRAELNVPLEHDWAAGLGLGYFHYQGNDLLGPILIDELRVLPMIRYYLSEGNVSPYLSGGAGLAVQFSAVSGVITPYLNPDTFLGFGLEIHLAAREAIFVETNYSLMLAGSILAQDIDIVTGLRSGF